MGWNSDPLIEEEEEQDWGKDDPVIEAVPAEARTIGGLAGKVVGDESLLDKFNARASLLEKYPEYAGGDKRIKQALREKYPQAYAEEAAVEKQKAQMAETAKRSIKESWFPQTKAGLVGLGAGVASPIARLISPKSADFLERFGSAYEQAGEEQGKGGIVPSIVKRGYRGVIKTLPPMVIAGRAGGQYAAIGAAALQETNSALTEGRDAGLSGEELGKYALQQGAIEGGVEGLFSVVGLGGVEKVVGGRRALQAGTSSALKNLGITTLQELPEELITEIEHNVARATYGVDPNATSLESLGSTAADTTVQTVMTLGLVGGPAAVQTARIVKNERNVKEILEAAAGDQAPSRKWWKKHGLSPESGRTAESRLVNIKAIGEALVAENLETPEVEQQEIPFIQEATEAGAAPIAEQVTPEAIQQVAPELTSQVEEISQGEIPFTQEATEALEIESPFVAPDATSVKKDTVADLRERRGEEPVDVAAPETVEQWVEEATSRIKSGDLSPDALIAELKESPRAVDEIEVAAIQYRYRELYNSLAAASNRLFDAERIGNVVEMSRADAASNFLLQQVRDIEETTRQVIGAKWSRTGTAMKMLFKPDFSLGSLIMRSRVAKGGEQLTPLEHAEVTEMASKIGELQAKLDERDSKQELHRIESAVDEEMLRSRPKKGFRKPTARLVGARMEAEAAWKDFSARFFGDEGAVAKFVTEEKAALDLEAMASAVRLVKAYTNLGVTTFSEFYAGAKAHLGQKVDDAREELKQAWLVVKGEGGIHEVELDPEDTAAVSRFAKKQVRAVVEAGTTDREAAVDLVHEELQQVIPDITRQQTMDAIAGYGIYSELAKDEVSTQVRDIVGQLQQLSKIADMKAGRAPKKTGREQRSPSDTERELTKMVNELKRRGGFSISDPDKQLKTALGAAKTAVKNQITDMTTEIQRREKIVKQKTPLKPDEELLALRKKRDELKVEYDAMFPRQPLTDVQKAAIAEKALDRVILQLESDIKSGDIAVKKRVTKLSSPTLNDKRDKLESLRQQRDAMRDALNPKLPPEERRLAAYKISLLSRLSELDRRMKEGDFSKKKKKELPLDKEATNMKFLLEDQKLKFKQMEKKWALSHATVARKLMHYTANTLNASRALMTSFDLSAVFRQAAPAVYAHPIIAAKNVVKMLRSFASKKSEFEIMEELRGRKNWLMYIKSKLAITATGGALSKQEEDFMGDWAQRIWGVRASGRAYTTFLNQMRADVFDSMVATMGKSGEVTDMEAKVIAGFVNAMTGRANLGSAQAASEFLATVFFSPKFVVSRFQLVVGRHMWGGNARTRKAIAKEYARSIIGMGTFVSSVFMLSKLFYPDDEPPTVELDSRSSDFGVIKWGDKRLDFVGGIAQATTLLFRVITGTTKRATGEIVSIVGKDVPFGGSDLPNVLSRFLRGKLSPWLGTAIDVRTGTNIVGEEVTPTSAVMQSIIPLSFRDIYDAMREEHIGKGAALSALVVFGMAVRKYQNATPGEFAKKIAKHEKLVGFNKKSRESFDYIDEVSQVVAQAKATGLTEGELVSGLIEEMKSEGAGSEAISNAKKRFRKRFSEL